MSEESYRFVFYKLLYDSLIYTMNKYHINQFRTEDDIINFVIYQWFENDWFDPRHPLYNTFNVNRKFYNDMRIDWKTQDAITAFRNAKTWIYDNEIKNT